MQALPASAERSESARDGLVERYRRVRAQTEQLCAPLETDDYQVQSVAETSPPK